MKSQQRHQLETNSLAKRLNVLIAQIGPYTNVIIGAFVALLVVVIGWRIMSTVSANAQSGGWNDFQSVVGRPLETPGSVEDALSQLAETAETYQGTPPQRWATLTWADGQVFTASQQLLQNRDAAYKALNSAASKYKSIISTDGSDELADRARFGLGRVYEMQNEPERAREEYLKVAGGFAPLAKQRAEKLADPKSKETLEWLAKAEITRPTRPVGPGTPGVTPPFDPGDFMLPGASNTTDPGTMESQADELLRTLKASLEKGLETTGDRYGTGGTPKDDGKTDDGKSGDGQAPGGAEKGKEGGTETADDAAKTPANTATPTNAGAPTPGVPPAGGAAAGKTDK